MTISSENRVAGPYDGNGTTASFPFSFKVFSKGDLLVVKTIGGGADTPLALGADFDAVLNADQDSNPGGTVNLAGPLSAGQKVTITSNVEALQQTDLTNLGGFYPKVVTNALDKLTVLLQQVIGQGRRTITAPISDGSVEISLPNKVARAGMVLGFDDGGMPVAVPNDNVALGANLAAIEEARAQAVIAGEAAVNAALEAVPASELAVSAKDAAEAARDVAQLSVGMFASTASGIAGTTNGQYFSVPSGEVDEYVILYRNNTGTATEVKRYPSVAVLDRIAGDADFTGYSYVIVDRFNRIAFGIKPDGKILTKAIATQAGNDLDVVAQAIGAVASPGDFSLDYAITDASKRVAFGIRKDGVSVVKDIVSTAGDSLVETAETARQALSDAASGGASDFRKTMVAAREQWGCYPRSQMASPPTLSLVQDNNTPAGTSLVPWNTSGVWRTSGGFTSQFGGNAFLQWKSRSPEGNAAGFAAAGGVAVETIHTGTVLRALIRGSGAGVRVLVGDATGKKLGYVSKTKSNTSPDGQGWILTIDFGAVSATRRITIEADGHFQFGGFWVKTGESIAQPSGTKPLVCCMGTSITEADNSWARWFGYLLGADVYNVGVGSSGILNPGVSPRVKQMDRSQDFTVGSFVLGIDENGVNDTGDALYSATDYATIVREFGNEYRRVLDAWFSAHPNSPFIGWGPYWANSTPATNAYRLRDAKQRVLSEYPLTAFIDTLTPGNLIQGNVSSGTYPGADYLLLPDTTHPIEVGHEFIGQRLFGEVDRLIRTVF